MRNDHLQLGLLPDDMLHIIASSLPPEDLWSLSITNRRLRQLIRQDQVLWEQKYQKHFPHLYADLRSSVTDWYAQFKETYRKEYKDLAKSVKRLLSTCKEGLQLHAYKLELSDLEDLEKMDEHPLSPLAWAKDHNNLAFLNYFFQNIVAYFDHNYGRYHSYRETLLLPWAARCFQPTEQLLMHTHSDARETPRDTPLMIAAQKGEAETVELLITTYQENINAQNAMGATSLLFAVELNHESVVDVLLRHNADTTIPLRKDHGYHRKYNVITGYTPLHAAIRLGRVNIVKKLLETMRATGTQINGHALLKLAAVHGQTEIIELLITTYQANINVQSNLGETPLLLAVERNHESVVDVLLNHNADTTIPLRESNEYHKQFKVIAGDTPLHAAIRLGHTNIVKKLLEKYQAAGTSINDPTLLMIAAKEGKAEIAELLITTYGANINAQNEAGETPLLLAARHGHENVVDFLLKNNAETSTSSDNTPLNAVIKQDHLRIAGKIKLMDYTNSINKLADTYHKKHITFFGRTYNFGYSAKQKKDASEALKSVVFNGADKACLDLHQGALHNGELGSIAKCFR